MNRPLQCLFSVFLSSVFLMGCGQYQPETVVKISNDDVTTLAKTYRSQCQSNITSINQAILSLEEVAPPYSVQSVLEPLNNIETQLSDAISLSSLYQSVHPDKTLRDIAEKCTTDYADIATGLALSGVIYKAVNEVDVATQPADTQRYHFTTLRSLKLAGVDKDEKTRKKIRQLQDKITQLGQKFSKNILEDVRYLEVRPEDLKGLPDDFIASKPLESNGKIKLSTRYVDTIPVYTYAHSDSVRKKLRQLDRSRAYPQNEAILKDILVSRHKLAALLGFKNYADYITADKMIGNAANAQVFIDKIHSLAQPAVLRDQSLLLSKLRESSPGAQSIERWQASYLEELIRREKFQVDASEVRQYFSYRRVRDGIFALVSEMYSIDIKPWKTESWHASVESYEMYQNSKLIARFQLDMHPREGKYQHAAAFTKQVGIKDKQLPISVLVCNFSGGDDPGEVMEFTQVRTFLHEFGHLIHALFGGQQRWASLSGIATEWDFVEAPSQMLEEWLYDKNTLQSFATNSAGDVIPDELISKLKNARYFGQGTMTAVQMYYAALSLQYHRFDPEAFDLTDKMIELETQYSPFPHQDGTYLYSNLGHLDGYSAIYYTYMWSKVMALDMFSEFETAGLRNKQVAQRYRREILAPGGTVPAKKMLENFLGRPYNFNAFSQRIQTSAQFVPEN